MFQKNIFMDSKYKATGWRGENPKTPGTIIEKSWFHRAFFFSWLGTRCGGNLKRTTSKEADERNQFRSYTLKQTLNQ
jgi:hypothetical protein